MKTNATSHPAAQFQKDPVLRLGSRLGIAVRPLFAAVCASLLSFLAAPAGLADSPDGEYVFESSSGGISLGGKSISLPQKQFKDKIPVLRNGRMVIDDGKMRINRKTGKLIIRRVFEILRTDVDTTLTGPTYIQLHRTGETYVGSTVRAVVVALDGTVGGDDMNGHLRTNITAKVRGDTLKLTISISGRLLGQRLNGVILATCRREP